MNKYAPMHGNRERRDPHQSGVLEIDAAPGGGCHVKIDNAEAQQQRDNQLHDADAEIPHACVPAERRTLQAGGVEEGHVGHAAGESAAAKPSGRRCDHHKPQRSRGLRHQIGERKAGDVKQRGGDDGPIAAAEHGWSEGVRETGQRAEQSWYRYERKELVRGVRKAGLRQPRYDDAPDQPDRKAVMQGEHRPDEIAEGDFFTCRLPELLILWPPVRNLGSVVCADIDGLHVCDHFVLPYACADDSRGWNRW